MQPFETFTPGASARIKVRVTLHVHRVSKSVAAGMDCVCVC